MATTKAFFRFTCSAFNKFARANRALACSTHSGLTCHLAAAAKQRINLTWPDSLACPPKPTPEPPPTHAVIATAQVTTMAEDTCDALHAAGIL